MKWTKLGKIFDPTDHRLAHNCVEYAQSPQAVAIAGGVRIYFSTRERDETGKFLSHISYVDFDSDFSTVKAVADHTVVPLGEIGDFDEHGIFPIHLFKNEDELWGYTTGWNRKVSVSADASIGLAVSRDGGQTFTKTGKGPVLSSSLHEPFLIGDAFVAKENNDYHMWYIFGKEWIHHNEQPERVYKIGHAVSDDGVNWRKDGVPVIQDKLKENECQALPSVAYFNKKHHMVFCYRSATDFRIDSANSYRLGYAHSEDLQKWTRDDDALGMDVSPSGWDSDMMCYPHLFAYNDRVWLLYNGNEFGRYGFGLAVLEIESD